MVQVQLRMPERMVEDIDEWVEAGRFRSRSDAIKTIVSFYEEKLRTMDFFKMLMKRSKEAKENPEILMRLDDLDV